jgi:hypothetical protein
MLKFKVGDFLISRSRSRGDCHTFLVVRVDSLDFVYDVAVMHSPYYSAGCVITHTKSWIELHYEIM